MLAAQNWGMFVLRGVIAILFGLFALLSPNTTLEALVIVFAAFATIDGITALLAGLGAPGGPRWLIVIGGILGIAVGVYAFLNPQMTATALVFVIGLWSILVGAFVVAAAILVRKMIEGEWLDVISGVVSVLFGVYLVIYPGNGAIALLWLIGYYAIFYGVMWLIVGWRLRAIAHGATPSAA